ncbi:MAG: hypothetical protein V9H69_23665 [Anaerolineae bacterium]
MTRSPFTVRRSPFSALLVALLLTLPALLPLLRGGFFVSDDGLFHVYRTAALAEAWQQGVLWPRLFPDFGFGYGQAVLNFYAPLSYAPGALLAVLGMNPATAVQVVIGLSFLLAAAAAFGYGNFLFGPAGGVLAAVVYTYTPYHLADAYLRGAVPEHVAFIFPPLILWAFTAWWGGIPQRMGTADGGGMIPQRIKTADGGGVIPQRIKTADGGGVIPQRIETADGGGRVRVGVRGFLGSLALGELGLGGVGVDA